MDAYVVATEVRNLAQRCASAAREIKELINDSVAKVDAGSALASRAGTTMEQVEQSVRRVSDIINDISAAGAEQSDGIEQVNEAITAMDNTTQQNAALVEEAAAAADALREQANSLSRAVSVFKLHEDMPRHAIVAMRAKAPAQAIARRLPAPRKAA
ncbi:MAG: methyl-accepting chemotaxis protein [Pseudomonadota bacterium]